ncbi:unnamed protein product [Spirodela intermedia]|uniref:GOLD domain-containing protein n=1 Tax=Spirodela intermedia TaxID=51605 RepID=A0A7I8IQ77_SPIIN|nr:unnamed protein product [Spirodela intermedia]CAA6659725.1 unnamed protein product [Spirodela intermedia]
MPAPRVPGALSSSSDAGAPVRPAIGHTKCIAEDIRVNSLSVGKYSVINPNAIEGHQSPPSRRPIAWGLLACFWSADHKPAVTMTVEFEWKSGVAAKDWPNVAKKGQVEMMEAELKKMEETVQSIHDEMFYLRSREEEMQELNRTTNSRMAWLSFLSLGVCLSVAGLQLWHLKTFFERSLL